MEAVKEIKVSDIVPDENQPRKYFAADKMATLKKSVRKHGIMSPIIVEQVGNKYLLIDGERRFRTAQDLGLKEIPAVVEKPTTAVERLVRQFNVQEQHEEWTPVEKAQALMKLSEEMGLSINQICDLVNTTEGDKRRYVAFASLSDKAAYIRNEVPLAFASQIVSLTSSARRLSEDVLEKKINLSDIKNIEHRVIDLVKQGEIRSKHDVSRLKDAFTANPKLITEFMEKGGTPSDLFTKSKAKGAYHLRNAYSSAGYVNSHGQAFLKLRDVKMTERHVRMFKAAKETLEKLIDLGE